MHYVLSRARIEHFAVEVLNQYKPDCLTIPQALDVYDFMENFMELTIDYKNLSPDESILGLTSFNDGIYLVWNDERTKQYPIEVKNGTVILENALLDSKHNGRERFTVIHECSHQILHRDIFARAFNLSTGGLVACARRHIESSKKKLATSRDWIEWQANALAAAMLMPKQTTREVFCEKMRIAPEEINKPIPLTLGIDLLLFEMADVFKVSHKAMKIRVEQLGLIQNRVYDFDFEGFVVI